MTAAIFSSPVASVTYSNKAVNVTVVDVNPVLNNVPYIYCLGEYMDVVDGVRIGIYSFFSFPVIKKL